MSKQAIIDKILSDANLKADGIIGEATQRADSLIAAAEAQSETIIADSDSSSKKEVSELLARAKTVAELDARKLILKRKADMVEQVFQRTLQKLTKLTDAQYKKLLLGMLSNAQDGDTVALDERGLELIKDEVPKYAKRKKISLTIDPDAGDFAGGMILSGGGVDKNLTFEVEVALLKEEYEAIVAKEIFG